MWDTVEQRVIGLVTQGAIPDDTGRLRDTAFAVPAETLVATCPTGLSLMLPNDPLAQATARLHFEPETIYIPMGKFWMGSELDGIPELGSQMHQIYLSAYRIGKFPVTNREYAEFIRQTNHKVLSVMGWEGRLPPGNKLNHPVAGLTWYDAVAYCNWLTQTTVMPYKYMLPSEAQWEKAARGGLIGQLYPWGDEWDPDRANHGRGQTTAVDAFPAQNQYGCYDIVGNVREWTSTLWGLNRSMPDSRYSLPWQNDGRDDLTVGEHIRRVYRGGSWDDELTNLRCNSRGSWSPDNSGPHNKWHGFRVVVISQFDNFGKGKTL